MYHDDEPSETVAASQLASKGNVITPEEVSRPYRFFRMEAVQSLLAYIFALILLLIIVWSFLNTRGEGTLWTRTKELLDIFVPVVTSLLGSAVGFYFGQKVPGP